MKDEASRIYGYTFISKAISKFRLSTKVYIIICQKQQQQQILLKIGK